MATSIQKARKKPVVVEVAELDFTNNEAIADIMVWAGDAVTFEGYDPETNHFTKCSIHTLEGTMTAKDGDIIIRGVKGEFYPCDSDIYRATYEDVID